MSHNNKIGEITRIAPMGKIPPCGIQGFVTVTLPEGAYLFKAKERKLLNHKEWNGIINVKKGKCKSLCLTK